jgi:hypothetical protein
MRNLCESRKKAIISSSRLRGSWCVRRSAKSTAIFPFIRPQFGSRGGVQLKGTRNIMNDTRESRALRTRRSASGCKVLFDSYMCVPGKLLNKFLLVCDLLGPGGEIAKVWSEVGLLENCCTYYKLSLQSRAVNQPKFPTLYQTLR